MCRKSKMTESEKSLAPYVFLNMKQNTPPIAAFIWQRFRSVGKMSRLFFKGIYYFSPPLWKKNAWYDQLTDRIVYFALWFQSSLSIVIGLRVLGQNFMVVGMCIKGLSLWQTEAEKGLYRKSPSQDITSRTWYQWMTSSNLDSVLPFTLSQWHYHITNSTKGSIHPLVRALMF